MPFDPARLKEARSQAKLTQNGLALQIAKAKGVGLTNQTVYRWERGMNPPDANMLELIASITGKSVDFFYTSS
jgi:transcriptional regulator with XRE-family HTH domain